MAVEMNPRVQQELDYLNEIARQAAERSAARRKAYLEDDSEDAELKASSERDVERILADIHGVERVILGFWDCENSPIGYCYYDGIDDYTRDYCLSCGDPSERK